MRTTKNRRNTRRRVKINYFSLKNQKIMKKLSYFAKKNPKIAIALIILGCTLFNISAFLLGGIWAILELPFSEAIIWAIVVFIPLIFFVYYKYKLNYLQRKLSEGSVYFLTSVLVFSLSFQFFSENESHFIPNTYEFLYASTLASPPISKKEIRKLVREYKPLLKKYLEKKLGTKGKKLWLKILLTIGSLAVFIFLLAVVAVISCELSCSGQDVAAVAVGFGGIALLVWGFIVLLRLIWKKRPAEDKSPSIKLTEQ